MTHATPPHHRRGFSIVEIVVALLIIGVLTLILIPIYNTQVEKSRLAACDSDLERIADAQTRACIDLSYYLRVFALDDVRTLGASNSIDAEFSNGEFANVADNANKLLNIFIDPRTGMFSTTAASKYYSKWNNNSASGVPPTMEILDWNGPYLAIQRDEATTVPLTNWTIPTPDFTKVHIKGIPNDPWGNDYLFFTKAGLLIEPDGVFVSTYNYRDAGGTVWPLNCLVFNRPTILSLGPNGAPGDPASAYQFGQGDDRYRSFEY